MSSIKISQLPAKGANIAPNDLLEISEFTGTGYVSKSITGQEIIDSVTTGVAAVTATAPIFSSGGTTPDISITPADSSTDGYLTYQDYLFFSNKQQPLVSGSNIKTLNGNSLLGFGDLSVQPTLVSSTNIKTINGSSILGSGNLAVGSVTGVSATSPLTSSGGTTPSITISQATTSTNGYLSSTDWNTFNNKQDAFTLTTTGTSGAATLVGSTLNIPQYSGGSGESGIHTQFKLPSGSIYSNIALGANSASQALTSGFILIMPFKPAQTFTTSNFLISTTVAAALSTTRILLYSHSDTNGLPDIKLYESADLDTSTTGLKTATTSQTFTAGTTYWLGVYSNGAPTLAAAAVASLIQIGMSSSVLTQYTSISRTVVYGFAPSIWGVSGNLISSNFPRIGLTIS